MIKERFQVFMSEQGLNQTAAAHQLGISASALCLYLKGKYRSPASIESRISKLLDSGMPQAQPVIRVHHLPFAMTTIATHVMQTLEYAQLESNISVVYGDAGIGKTRATNEWVVGKANVILLTVSPALSSPKSFLKYLASLLKTSRVGHIDELYLELCERLLQSGKMLIVDEAQHLKLPTLEIIRGIQEATGVAVALIGNETVYTKMIGRHAAEFAQLFSRIGWRKHLLTDHISVEDVESVFGRFVQPASLKPLFEICRSKYGLRGAINVYVNAANNGDLSPSGLKQMAQVMEILR